MKAMLVLLSLIAVGCGDDAGRKYSSDPIQCGSAVCGPDQACGTITAGHTCDTNPDAGIGEYAVLGQACMDIPTSCGDTLSCDCIAGCSANGYDRPCLNVSDRQVSCGCF